MYKWENGVLIPGTVVRAHSADFYDCKNEGRLNKRRMYVVVKEMPKYIFFYTYYTNHNITRDEIDKSLDKGVVKSLSLSKK